MKNLHASSLLAGVILLVILLSGYSSGPATSNSIASTGAPSANGGIETKCGNCHNGGASYGEPAVSLTVAETLGGAGITSYVPGQTYFVTANISANDNPAGYGFQALFIDVPGTGIPQNAGSLSELATPDPNTQVAVLSSGRNYAEHSGVTPSGVFQFRWTAPASGTGQVDAYVSGNAVNENFGTSGDMGSDDLNIFSLQEAATLPVTLSAFTARSEKTTVYLDWETSLEENADRFEVERSANGTDFAYVTEVSANGRSNRYAISDENVATGNYFYRLRMVDLDGTSAFSPLVSVTVSEDFAVRAWPNPVANTLNFNGDAATAFRLLNANGSVVMDGLTGGQANVSGLKAGIYLLEATSDAGRKVRRIVKR